MKKQDLLLFMTQKQVMSAKKDFKQIFINLISNKIFFLKTIKINSYAKTKILKTYD